MFCINCGTSLPEGANFCFKCGCDLRNLTQSPGTSHSTTHELREGEYITFGRYPQKNGNAKDPIEWLVLEINGDEALLVSRYGLDCRPYHHELVSITWENCDLRRWLNHDFLKSAFSEEEQQRIKLSELENYWNNTRDRVFCLSLAEAELYFENDGERRCQPTAHVSNQGAYIDNGNGCCSWWLRSDYQHSASLVLTGGGPIGGGSSVYRDDLAVRPAIRIICNQYSSNLDGRVSDPLQNGTKKRGYDLRNPTQSPGTCHSATRTPRVGEYITFGRYPQNDSNNKVPIEWLVLEVKGSEALVISRYGLDCIKYHDVYLTTVWEECYLRKWLNNDFMKMAFSNEDIKRIKLSELANDNNQKFGTYGGNTTKDQVFCLSIAEAVQYFKNNDERLCKPTAFAESHGALNYNGYCFWWLRSPGHDLDSAANVGVVITENLGAISMQGSMVDLGNLVVRPALRLKL